jgi:hypothetical protein
MFGIIALILAIILYLVIALQNFYDKDYSHCFIWVSYACANIGMLLYELDKLNKLKGD